MQVAEPSQAPAQSVHHVPPSELASDGRFSHWSALARRVCRGRKGVVSIDRGHSSLTCHVVVSDIYKPEESLRAWAEKLNRARRSLTGVNGELPTVEIEHKDA